MPGFDRTGPWGEGPMTGGGRGYCSSGWSGNRPPRFGLGRGRSRGRGMRSGFGPWYGSGPGFGWGGYPTTRRGGFGPGYDRPYPLQPSEELNMLKAEADIIKKDLEEINRRVEELKKEGNELNSKM